MESVAFPKITDEGLWFYVSALFLLFSTAGFFALINERNLRTIATVCVLVFLSFFLRIVFANYQSFDWCLYLNKWCGEYRDLGLGAALRSTTSNYVPLYNYFLIFFSKLPIYDLYLIKVLSFVFEVLSAWAVVKIVSKVTNKRQSPIIFGGLLVVPFFLIDSTVFAQCDAIYTFFGLMGIYYMLCKKSIPSYIFFGLGLAIKFHAVLVFPIILVLLFAKNKQGERYLNWKYLWIIPLPFFILNCVPLFAGKSFANTFGIYYLQFTQATDMVWMSPNPSVPFLFNRFTSANTAFTIIFLALTAVLMGAVLGIVIYQVIKKKRTLEYRDILFLMLFMQLLTILFIPRFFIRYNYFLILLLIIYALSTLKKEDLMCALMLVTSFTFILATVNSFDARVLEMENMHPGHLFRKKIWLLPSEYSSSWTYLPITIFICVFVWYAHKFYRAYIKRP
jgi:Gpi18-like mannosyltransferase